MAADEALADLATTLRLVSARLSQMEESLDFAARGLDYLTGHAKPLAPLPRTEAPRRRGLQLVTADYRPPMRTSDTPLQLPDDDGMVAAVVETIRHIHTNWLPANQRLAPAEMVAVMLHGVEGPRPSRGDLVRVGKRLAKLAREGRLIVRNDGIGPVYDVPAASDLAS